MSVKGVVLYTDGSFRHGRCGWGVHGYTYTDEVLEKAIPGLSWKTSPTGYVDKNTEMESYVPDQVIEAYGNIPGRGTNILAEVLALKYGMEYIRKHPEFKESMIRTDSEYAIKTLTTYVPKWKKNNWRKSDGSEAAHAELWKEMDELHAYLLEHNGFKLLHVKGHEGEYGNEAADTMARLGSGELNVTHHSEKPFDVYLESFKNDAHHPLIQRSRLVFNVGGDNRPGVYYNYRLGKSGKGPSRPEDDVLDKLRKSEVYLGAWLSDQTFTVVVLDEPEPIIEKALAVHRAEFERDTIDVGVLRIDSLYGKETLAVFDRLGRDALSAYPADRTLMNAKDEAISRTLTPPQRAYDAVIKFNMLERHLGEFMENKLGANCTRVDLTSRLIESTQANSKSKVTWRAVPDLDKAKSIDVAVPGFTAPIKLLVGVDLPVRNALNRLASPECKVELLVWTEGKRYYYEVVVIAKGCAAIYSSPQVSYILK